VSSSYDDLDVHRAMLEDEVRTRAFERAISEVVRPGHAVLDFGCGTGILAFFAARARARVVYAVDRSPMARAAEAVARRNGLDAVRVLVGEDVALPERVDVIVSEWMGHFAFQERMLEPLLAARDRWLAPGGTMVPARVTLHVALAFDPSAHDRLGWFRRRPYGIDWGPVAEAPFSSPEVRSVDAAAVVTPPAEVGVVDALEARGIPERLSATLVPARDGDAHGIVGWFDVRLSPGVAFSTAPGAPETHWRQTFFPFPKPLRLRAGRGVRVEVDPLAPDPRARGSLWRWSADDGTDRIEGDDVVWRAWLARGR
jgi:SAM-dependent methyltransferase